MAKSPNSYKDPYWNNLIKDTEKELGIPNRLLYRIVTRGERSNNDQVSDAGARTIFQIIPQTRKAALDKYGIDAYLNDENASKVAGLLIKDSLKRNNGDEYLTSAEYIGGTDRKNWGPITKSYVKRVLGEAKENVASESTKYQSIFEDEQLNQPPVSAIKSIYDAYQSGKMDAQQKKEFEEDVNGGKIILPAGASLHAANSDSNQNKSQAILLPQSVTDAYVNGKLNEQQRAELEEDIRNGMVKLPPSKASLIPGESADWEAPTEQGVIERPKNPTLGEKLVGAGETALSTLTGLTGGTAGLVGGAAKGLVDAIAQGTYGTQQGIKTIEDQALKGSEALTYIPRTETGQQYAQNVGKVLQETLPLAGLSGELAALNAATRSAIPAAQAATRAAAVPIGKGINQAANMVQSGAMNLVNSVKNMPNKAAEMTGLPNVQMAGLPNAQMAGIGALETAPTLMRLTTAENLPVPIKLTKGAASRDAEQLAFEKEQMKGALGEPLRKRAEENNLQALQNFDTLIDQTGIKAADIGATGGSVVKALTQGWDAAKAETNVAYTKAKKSPEALAEVDPNTKVTIGKGEEMKQISLIDYLNSVPDRLNTTGLIDDAKHYAIKLGIATRNEDGTLIPLKTNVKTMEELRKQISQATGYEPIDRFYSGQLKQIIDQQTGPVAGPLYKKARALREQQARKFENRAIVARLINNKRGMDDPQIAVDQVFNRSVLNGSPEELTFLKRVLHTTGKEGQQAWKDLQGETIQYLKRESSKGLGLDSNDNPIISPSKLHNAVSQLDKNGRLDILLGKKQAETIRDLNDVVRYVSTVPPGTLINNSGTVGTLISAMTEAGATGVFTGLPIPVLSLLKYLSRHVKNKKLKLKINDALNGKSSAEKNPKK